jgi:neutral ceramidase
MKKAQLVTILVIIQLTTTLFTGYTQKYNLSAGIARIDITPNESLYMGGYASTCRTDPSDGSFGKIYVRALVFDDNTKRVAFIEANLVGLSNESNLSIRKSVEAETGIPAGNIMLGCTHNHAAPTLSRQNSESEWYKEFNDKVVKVIKDAIADLEPVKVGGGIGRSHIAMNRRKILEDTISYITFDENNSSQSFGIYKTGNPVLIREMEGVCRIGANPDGPVDEEVGIMRIDNLSGQPKAVYINYACHGTEWNGHMLEYVEKKLPGVTGIFAQGAAGDINPRFIGGLEGYKDNLENTAQLGYEIGKEVVNVFSEIKTDYPVNPEIKIVHKNVVCPLKYELVAKDFKNTTIEVPSTGIRIDDFTWVSFPGELFHEIGQTIKLSTHARYPFLVGYCNGSLGYMPTQTAYSEGGYETWRTRFAPVTEQIFTKEVAKMLVKLH